ncbi:MAG: hypothetical protein JXP34_02745 [Planctomycetes bacterium]|nr:hypothetical protein [Planctomycetota bacterium]
MVGTTDFQADLGVSLDIRAAGPARAPIESLSVKYLVQAKGRGICGFLAPTDRKGRTNLCGPPRSGSFRLKVPPGPHGSASATVDLARLPEACREASKVVALGRDGTMVNVRGEGWREAMAGTICYYGEEGTSLEASYVSQMPEYGRARFEEKLTLEVRKALECLKAGARVVCLGDGAEANWDYFHTIPELTGKPRCLDFMHANGHLSQAAEAIFGDDVRRRESWREKYRTILEKHGRGAEKVIRSMPYHLSTIPKKQRSRRGEIRKVIKYFSRNLDRMKYRWLRDHHLPIGSGIVEASCKSVIGARL